MRTTGSFFWRRLDQPGLDSCRLLAGAGGFILRGAAVFREARLACHLAYEVAVDASWRTRRATVRGHVGHRPVDLRVTCAARGRWRLDGALAPRVAGCVDLDLGFTPATNMVAIRRLGLAVGEAADAPAAYLEVPRMRFVTLPQRYTRLARNRYAYESPTSGYAGTLDVLPSGAIRRYPEVFELLED